MFYKSQGAENVNGYVKFLYLFVALGGASLVAEERGIAKPRGRGRGRRNRKQWRVLTE